MDALAGLAAAAARFLKNYPEPVIAVVTSVYTLVSLLQWRALKRANKVAQQTLALSQRPWVEIRPKGVKGGLRAGEPLKLMFVLRNYGRSPAFVTDLKAKIHVGPFGRPPADAHDYVSSEAPFVELTLFPDEEGNELVHLINTRLSEKDVQAIHATQSKLYLYLLVRYRDSLGKPHSRQQESVYDTQLTYFTPVAEHRSYDYAD